MVEFAGLPIPTARIMTPSRLLDMRALQHTTPPTPRPAMRCRWSRRIEATVRGAPLQLPLSTMPLQAKVMQASAPWEASSCGAGPLHTPRCSSHSLR
jgi:hypothetical protein